MFNKLEQLEFKLEKKILGFRNMHEKLENTGSMRLCGLILITNVFFKRQKTDMKTIQSTCRVSFISFYFLYYVNTFLYVL